MRIAARNCADPDFNPQPPDTMNAKHTPAPWKVLPGQDLVEIVKPNNGSGHNLIASLTESPLAILEVDANARLIAAAPALLEALKGALQHLATVTGLPDKGKGRTPEQQAALDAASAAIARATNGGDK